MLPPETWVIVPAYNEEQQIGAVLVELCLYPYRILVVDDGSDDRTAQAAMKYPVTVLRHITNLGQGAALQTGICYALRFPETRYIVTFDADGQHHAADIPNLVEACRSGNFDVVLGSRFMKNGRAIHMDWPRKITLVLAVLLTRLMTGLRLTDTHNGLKLFTAQAARKINLVQDGMAHASEMLSKIARYKMRYCEVPVTVTYSDYSKKKGQSFWNGINILWELLEGYLR